MTWCDVLIWNPVGVVRLQRLIRYSCSFSRPSTIHHTPYTIRYTPYATNIHQHHTPFLFNQDRTIKEINQITKGHGSMQKVDKEMKCVGMVWCGGVE